MHCQILFLKTQTITIRNKWEYKYLYLIWFNDWDKWCLDYNNVEE